MVVFMSYRIFHVSVRNGEGEFSLSCDDDWDSSGGACSTNRSFLKLNRIYISYLRDTVEEIVYNLILPEQ